MPMSPPGRAHPRRPSRSDYHGASGVPPRAGAAVSRLAGRKQPCTRKYMIPARDEEAARDTRRRPASSRGPTARKFKALAVQAMERPEGHQAPLLLAPALLCRNGRENCKVDITIEGALLVPLGRVPFEREEE